MHQLMNLQKWIRIRWKEPRRNWQERSISVMAPHWISGLNSASNQRGRSLTFDPRRVNHADKWHSESGLLRIPQSTTLLSMTLDFTSIYIFFCAQNWKSHPSGETIDYSKRGVTMIDELPNDSGRKTMGYMEHTHTHRPMNEINGWLLPLH